jgi:CO/xanthine dehydrogenase Mo-binding subunit
LNAIKDATGVSYNQIPLLPEDLFAAAHAPAEASAKL